MSLFNYDHPWLDFNLFYTAEVVQRVISNGLVLGSVYQLIPWILSRSTKTESGEIPNKLLIDGFKLSLVAFLAWDIYGLRSALAPDFDDQASSKQVSALQHSKSAWMSRNLELSILPTAQLGTFIGTLALHSTLKSVNTVLPTVSSTAAIGFLALDRVIPIIKWQRISRWLIEPIYHLYINPERDRIAAAKKLMSSHFLRTNETGMTFEYPPISAPNRIRLLRFDISRVETTQTSCELVEVDLDSAPSYEALSYRWGSHRQSDTFSLLLDSNPEQHIILTQNAYDALIALTPLAGTRYIWIDSVCINQLDDVEKTQQLRLMKNIYSNAARVLVFLGSSSESLRTVSILNQAFHFYMTGILTDKKAIERNNQPHTIFDTVFAPSETDIQLLYSLIQNDYWTRAWIVQECILAKDATVFFGEVPVSWTILSSTVHFFSKQSNFIAGYTHATGNLLSAILGIAPLQSIAGLRVQYLRDKSLGNLLEVVLTHFINTQATNPRDNIYAFLGICDHSDASAMSPDYQKSVKQVYTDLVELSLSKESYITFSVSGLTFDSSIERSPGEEKLPSWLPRFNKNSHFNTIFCHTRSYKAGLSLKPNFRIVSDGDVLQMQGVIVDTIDRHTSRYDPFQTSQKMYQDPVLQVLLDHHARASEMDELFTTLNTTSLVDREAFWRTIFFDPLAGDGSIDLETYKKNILQFEELLQFLKESDTMESLSSDERFHRSMKEGYERKEQFQFADVKALFDVTMSCRPFGITRHKSLMVSLPADAKVGDVVAIFNGAPAPCILRPTGTSSDMYYFVGEAYVDGIMYGEGMNTGDLQWLNLG